MSIGGPHEVLPPHGTAPQRRFSVAILAISRGAAIFIRAILTEPGPPRRRIG